MPANAACSCGRSGRGGNKRALQRLRRDAGYRCAKEFAEVLHIPNSTYSRYERAPEGPDCGIPLQAAWVMADKLGCSIDLVVGREDIDAPREATLDARAGKLSRSGREMLDDFLRLPRVSRCCHSCAGLEVAPRVRAGGRLGREQSRSPGWPFVHGEPVGSGCPALAIRSPLPCFPRASSGCARSPPR